MHSLRQLPQFVIANAQLHQFVKVPDRLWHVTHSVIVQVQKLREDRFPIESGRLIRLLQLRHKTFNEASFPIEFGTVAN